MCVCVPLFFLECIYLDLLYPSSEIQNHSNAHTHTHADKNISNIKDLYINP